MEVRFPGIDWFCDNCTAYLNNQPNFDDRKYIWKCNKCGYKNSISAANIRHEDPILFKITGFSLGILRSLFAYTLTILFSTEVIFNMQPLILSNYRLLFLCAVIYAILMVVSLFFERVVAKYGIHKPLGAWILTTIPANIGGDIIRPFQEVLTFPLALINLMRLKLKGITFTKYFRKKLIYAVSYLILLFLVSILSAKLGLLGKLMQI